MQESMTDLARKLDRHPVLRVVKALTMVALAVIAIAFTVYFLRFTREVSRQAGGSAEAPAASTQSPAQQD